MSPHIREFKTVPWIPDSKAQDPEFLHQNFQDSRFNKQKIFRDSGFGLPCMARALGFRQIHLLSFSSQISRTVTREYSQIISTSSRWVKKVELYTSMLTCISQDGNDLLILETEDSTIQPALLALLVLQS